jgi:hypothetical protein
MADKPQSLEKCFVRLGIPNTSKEWTGDHFLDVKVIVKANGKEYPGYGQHMNPPPIPKGRFVDIPVGTPSTTEILHTNPLSIELHAALRQGKGEGDQGTSWRIEAVLKFHDGTILSTGYNEPARPDNLFPRTPIDDESNHFFTKKHSECYHYITMDPDFGRPIG